MSSTALATASTSTSTSHTAAGRSSPLNAIAKVLPILHATPRKHGTDGSPSTPTSTSTPQRQSAHWTHPRMDEVIRRRNATHFDSSNVTSILLSSGMIFLSLFTPTVLFHTIPTSWLAAAYPYPRYAVWTFQSLMLLNILIATLPLWRKPDACEDVPLTPRQRSLLGLPPMTRPATPHEQEQYVTPPRFSRSATTPTSRTSSLNATRGGSSPLSGRGTPLDGGSGSFRLTTSSATGSPWGSPAQGNQLRRTESGNSSLLLGGGGGDYSESGGERRRLSYTALSNNSSVLDISGFESIARMETPTKEKRASVGLNNKWLYQRDRGSSGSGRGLRGSLPAGSIW